MGLRKKANTLLSSWQKECNANAEAHFAFDSSTGLYFSIVFEPKMSHPTKLHELDRAHFFLNVNLMTFNLQKHVVMQLKILAML